VVPLFKKFLALHATRSFVAVKFKLSAGGRFAEKLIVARLQ
jgi:hypothetical protein